MIFFYKVLRIFKYICFFILLFVALYYTFIKDFFVKLDSSIFYKYQLKVATTVLDTKKKHIYYLFDSDFRLYLDSKQVPAWIYKVLFSKIYLTEFHEEFIKKYNFLFDSSTKDFFINYILINIYGLKVNLKNIIKINRLKKELGLNNFNEYIVNLIPFKKNIFGLEAGSEMFFHKKFQELNNNEILFCIANLEFFSKNNILDEVNLKENYYKLINLIPKIDNDIKINSNFNIEFYNKLNFELIKKEKNLSEFKTGISYEVMKKILVDYIIKNNLTINLMTNGYEIISSYDINFLRDLMFRLDITSFDSTNKMCLIYYVEKNKFYLLGILNLPYGRTILNSIENSKSMLYNNKKIFFEVTNLSWFPFVEGKKIEFTPVLKVY